ncbi:MAG: SRPBCC domain-containing protein [Acidobacteriota bacterium]
MPSPAMLTVEHRLVIKAQPSRVMRAFVDADDLSRWWQVVRSVTVPKPLGPYAVEWATTDFRDEILGPLGGALHGTIMEYRPGRELFLADAYWQAPEGAPVGPMAIEISVRPTDTIFVSEVRLRQSGEDLGPRWQRYFQIMQAGWGRALLELKLYLDAETSPARAERR